MIRVQLSCRWRCRGALSSPTVVIVVLSTVVRSWCETAVLPPLPHTRRSCADDRMCQGWRSHQRGDVEDALYSADREVRHCGMRWLGNFEAGVTWSTRSPAHDLDVRRPHRRRVLAHPTSIPATGTLSRLGHRHRALLRAGVMGLSAVSSAGCSRHLRCAAHVPEEVPVMAPDDACHR